MKAFITLLICVFGLSATAIADDLSARAWQMESKGDPSGARDYLQKAAQAGSADALEAMLKTGHFMSAYNFEFGVRSRDYGYHPPTGKDVGDWFAAALNFAEPFALLDSSVGEGVRHAIAQEFRGLWTNVSRTDELERIAYAVAAKGFWHDDDFDYDGPTCYELAIRGPRGGQHTTVYCGHSKNEDGRMLDYGSNGSHLQDIIARHLKDGWHLYYRGWCCSSKKEAEAMESTANSTNQRVGH